MLVIDVIDFICVSCSLRGNCLIENEDPHLTLTCMCTTCLEKKYQKDSWKYDMYTQATLVENLNIPVSLLSSLESFFSPSYCL